MRFLAKAQPSRMVHTEVTEAGLMDPAAIIYSSAIKIDYNTHTLEHLTIQNNVADGLEIMKNDVFANTRLANSVVRNNLGNGVSSRTSYFELYMCTLSNNGKAGFEYNPHYTTYEAQQIRAGIHNPIILNQEMMYVNIVNEGREFVTTPQKFTAEVKMYVMEVQVGSQHRVNMDIIDYSPDTEQENITVYESAADKIQPSTYSWTIEDDLADFPITSAGAVLTITWKVTGMASGRFAFVLRSSKCHNLLVQSNKNVMLQA